MADKRVWTVDRADHADYQEAMAKAKAKRRPGPGRYRVHWIDPGPPPKERNKTFRILGDANSDRPDTANAFRRKLERELNGDVGSIYIDPNAGDTPFGTLAEGWFAGLDELKRSTIDKYRSILDTHILPRWQHAPARAVTSMVIAPWMARLKKGGGETAEQKQKLGQSQKRLVFTIMSAIFDWACPEFLPSNPMRDKKKLRRPKPKRIHDHCYLEYLQVEALADLMDTLVGAYGKLKAGAAAGINGVLVRTLAYTGIRSGEALALRVKDYVRSRVRPVFKVSRTLVETDQGELYFDTPKDHEARDAAIPLSLTKGIDRLCAGKGPEDLIFSVDGKPLRFRNWRAREFNVARGLLGLPSALTPHKLRHTCASLAIAVGATVLAVQRLLGHASPVETLRTYAHLWNDEIWSVAEKLNTGRLQAISETAVMDGLVAVVADLARQLSEVRGRLDELETADGSEALHRELARVTNGTTEIDDYLRELSSRMDEAREVAIAPVPG